MHIDLLCARKQAQYGASGKAVRECMCGVAALASDGVAAYESCVLAARMAHVGGELASS
jgi:hypothetical protein